MNLYQAMPHAHYHHYLAMVRRHKARQRQRVKQLLDQTRSQP